MPPEPPPPDIDEDDYDKEKIIVSSPTSETSISAMKHSNSQGSILDQLEDVAYADEDEDDDIDDGEDKDAGNEKEEQSLITAPEAMTPAEAENLLSSRYVALFVNKFIFVKGI